MVGWHRFIGLLTQSFPQRQTQGSLCPYGGTFGLARVYSSEGKFDEAVKEASLAIAAAPEAQKAQLEGLKKRLEKKEDINR